MKILYLPNEYSQQRQREKKACIYPILMAMECEKRRQEGDEVYWEKEERFFCPKCNKYTPLTEESPLVYYCPVCKNTLNMWGKLSLKYDKVITEPEGLDFLTLPKPDRVFTRAMDKKYQQNGNFKYLPGTYIQSANGCWWGNCTFCVEKNIHYKVRDVNSVIEEIKECKQMGFREVFDDSGTFPTGRWLDDFIRHMYEPDVRIRWSCNTRLAEYPFMDMYNAGCRMVLFGVESANQKTLDIINKGVKCEDIKYIKKAARCGLEPHIAVIFGHPNETDEDAIRTLRLVWELLRKGYAKTAQASFYDVGDNEGNENHRKYIKKIYDIAYSPTFWFNKLRDIHDVDDLKYLWRSIKKGVGL